MSSGRNYNSYPGNRRPTPTAPPLSPRTPLSPLDIDPPIEDVYEQEERDAELARRLQAEEDAAIRQRLAQVQEQYNSYGNNNSNHHQPSHYNLDPLPYPSESPQRTNSPNTFRDNEYIPTVTATATRIHTSPLREDRIEYNTSPYSRPYPQSHLSPNHRHTSTGIDTDMNMAVNLSMETDEELARRTQQELRDEALAMELQRKEREARNNGRHNNRVVPLRNHSRSPTSHHANRGRGRCTNRRIFSAGIMAIIVGVAAICIVFFGSTIWEKLGGNAEDLPPFFQDPWVDEEDTNTTAPEFSQWRNKGKGLKLEIRNSLSDDWDSYFIQAVNDWNKSPALSLSTKNIAIDPDCLSVQGAMIVCNDYYGKTGWTGLNEVYFSGTYIAASVAKMNESYLKGKSDAEKQYVMCHELGHGFGLPHRDENANNPDLGSCLDYTYRYSNNKQPDAKIDFNNLLNLYGSNGDDNTSVSRAEGNGRNLRRQMGKEDLSMAHKEVKIENTLFRAMAKEAVNYKEGRLLHQSEHHEIYENDLGDGNRVVTTLLLS